MSKDQISFEPHGPWAATIHRVGQPKGVPIPKEDAISIIKAATGIEDQTPECEDHENDMWLVMIPRDMAVILVEDGEMRLMTPGGLGWVQIDAGDAANADDIWDKEEE